MTKQETLAITGFQDEPVPHTFFRQEQATAHLVVLFPGADHRLELRGSLRELGNVVARIDRFLEEGEHGPL
jgi:hypothetical protein